MPKMRAAAEMRQIAECFWGRQPAVKRFCNGERSEELNLDAYFLFYNSCYVHAFHKSEGPMWAPTEEQILWIAKQIRDNCTRESIRDEMARTYPSCSPDNSIDLAARLLFMLDFAANPPNAISGTMKVMWTHDTAKSSIEKHFSHEPEPHESFVYLDQGFTGYNIEQIAGIKIVWTDNLADHLRLVESDTKVAIFHHVTFLECQEDSLLPHGLVKETLQTIQLLFPQCEKRTIRKFQSCTIDPRLLRCGCLRETDRNIDNFFHWRDRLVILKQCYDNAKPKTINQWWRDRRNGVQWYTFWVAILILVLTIFFGLVQSIEGGLQVYKAFDAG